MITPPPEAERPAGCALQSCLTGAVVLFSLLLIAMLILVFLRMTPR